MTASNLGSNIKRIRGLRGLTQAQLAEIAGLSTIGISNIETGTRHPRPGTLEAIAKALGVSEIELHGGRSPGASLDLNNSELIGRIVAILPTLNEGELRNILATAESSPSLLARKIGHRAE